MAFSAQSLLLNTPTSAYLTPTKPKIPNTTTLAAFPLSQKRPVLRKTNATYTTRCCSVSAPSQMPRHPEYIPNRIPDDCYVRVMDTTLRDGEQAPGAAMTREEKIVIARQLAKLGVDVIEAGFPASSKDDLETVRQIAIEVGNDVDEFGWVPTICACCRCVRSDVEAAWEGVRHARRPRVNIFISTSEIHMKYKLNKTAEEVLKLAKESVSYARSLGAKDIEFICEDAGRSEKEFLYRIYGEAIKAGATTITFTDTVGYNFPNEVEQMIKDLKANIQGIENAIIAVHCHNDLGLANANTIAAAHAGARQIEVTINGIGERAGNASLEEFVMAVKSRGKDILGGLHTGINTKHIVTASKMVEEYSGLSIQPHKAIVGANVFSHASGIHQDGMLKNKSTYEIISPEDIGFCHSNETGIVLGKHSGRHALKSRLLQIGHDLDEKKLDVVFRHFKALAETKKCVTNEDIESFVSQHVKPEAVAI